MIVLNCSFIWKLIHQENGLWSILCMTAIYAYLPHIINTISGQVNLPESSLSWPSLLGILRNNEIGGKPGACFYIRFVFVYLRFFPKHIQKSDITIVDKGKQPEQILNQTFPCDLQLLWCSQGHHVSRVFGPGTVFFRQTNFFQKQIIHKIV